MLFRSNTEAPSIGVSLSSNTIRRDTTAELSGFASALPGSAVLVSSSNDGTIRATSVAAAVSSAVASTYMGIAAGGATSTNTITGSNQALISGTQLGSSTKALTGPVEVSASDDSAIHAEVDSVSAAGGAGGSGGAVAIEIGRAHV